jgi:phosphoglucomutase
VGIGVPINIGVVHLNVLAKFQQWLQHPYLDESLRNELKLIIQNEKEITSRFYKDLEFGTGGLRGIIGAGTNRMNIYTVRKATKGLALYIHKNIRWDKLPSVVIAYDSRRMSREFAVEAAKVLADNGIKAFVFKELTPTPVLSFAVRELEATAGIVITASHNPPEYNGYKVYWSDGGQITDNIANAITQEIAKVVDELAVTAMDYDEAVLRGLIVFPGDELVKKYISYVKTLSLQPELIKDRGQEITIVYSPLHGTGNKPVTRILREMGFRNVHVVPEQECPNGNFPTVKYPNPEEHAAFELAMKLGEKIDADILLATDPDADRVGVAVKDDAGKYRVITGNQLGALFLEYILSQRQNQGLLPPNGTVIKTIVTSEIGRAIAAAYGIETIDTLTGFKYIGEKIKEFKEKGERQFLFGYEESYGYLIGDEVRDKDAVQACLLAAEMALYYKTKGLTLYEQLQRIFRKYGFYREDLLSLNLEGKEGQERIVKVMEDFRKGYILTIAGKGIVAVEDYLNQRRSYLLEGREELISLPESNVLKYILEDASWLCIRPSGTEPKLKIYFGVCGGSEVEANDKLLQLKNYMIDIMNQGSADRLQGNCLRLNAAM